MSIFCIGINPEIFTDRSPLGIKYLSPNIHTFAVVMGRSVIVTPSDNKTAFFKAGNRRLILRAGNVCINEKLFANCVTVIIINLTANIGTGAAVMTTIIAPGDDKTALFEASYRRLILAARSIGIDPKLTINYLPVSIIALPIDAMARTILTLR